MAARPLALSGAAFLATVAAALFAPGLLTAVAIPLAMLPVLWWGNPRLVTGAVTGALAAVVCCGFFFAALQHAQSLEGQQQDGCTGVVYYQGRAQRVLMTLPDGSRAVVQPNPPFAGAQTGQAVACSLVWGLAQSSGDGLLFGADLLLPADVLDYQLLPLGSRPVPLPVAALRWRETLGRDMLRLNPAEATPVTLGLLLSHKTDIPYATRDSFSAAGMSHLLSTSGLHLSILVWLVAATTRALGGKRLAVAVTGSAAALLLCLAAGMSVSVLRAAIMTLLGLVATLFDRRSDGMTSLMLSAVVLVAACPPILGALSFQLSFAAVLGLLLLAPPLTQLLLGLVQRCGHTPGRFARLLAEGLAVSLAAQLATLPLVGWHFGSVPLLGLATNLVAIPLAYPILLLGALSAVALAGGLAPLAGGLLLGANTCSALLLLLARLVAAVPMNNLPTRFPLDFAPLVGAAVLAGLLLLPLKRPVRCRVLAGIAGVTAVATLGSLLLSYRTTTAVASRWDNSLQLLYRGQSVALAFSYDDSCFCRTAVPLSGPLPDWVAVASPSPLVTEITIGHTKIVKYCAVYDTIMKYGGSIPQDADLLVDCRGNLLSPRGQHLVVRREHDSFARLPRGSREEENPDAA